jgi:hypothetical protein
MIAGIVATALLAAIGTRLMNLMTATVKAPIQLLDPLTGKGQRDP